jgi:signal transduction histidine kinase
LTENKPRFDISASVVHQLGEDLITDEVTALIELVKNAYDADATYANVEVNTADYPFDENLYFTKENQFKARPGYISIEDDGIGMGRNEIESGWLTISLSSKRKMKSEGLVTLKKQRTPLGDKGLGRLSTQRLGQRLEMFTSRENLGEPDRNENDYNVEYHVAFDWADFTEDRTLTAVPLHFEIKKPSRKGTKLIISELSNREIWKGKDQDKLVSGLAQLLFPFGEVRPFNVFLKIDGERIHLDTLADRIRDVALGRFNFKFDGKKIEVQGRIRLSKLRGNSRDSKLHYDQFLEPDQGKDFFAYLTNPNNRFRMSNIEYIGKDGWFISFRHNLELQSLSLVEINGKIANPGKFHGDIDEFALRGVDTDPLEDIFSEMAEYNLFVKKQAGIRVFRDGFGIRPFGFYGDDWLGLSKAQTSGRSFYGLRPQNTIGYVALTAKENAPLKETTSREGFVDTPHSRNFYKIMEQVIKTINDDLYSKMRRSFTEYRQKKSESVAGIIQPDASFDEMRSISKDTLELESRVEKLEPKLASVSNEVSLVVEHIKRQPIFATEQEHYLSPLLDELNSTLLQVRDMLDQIKVLLPQAKRLGAVADSLQPRIEILETQLTEFSELAGLGLTAEALSHEIHTIAQRLAERTSKLTKYLKKNQIVNAEIVSYTEYVQTAISALTKQLSHLAPSLRYVREKKEKIDLLEFFTEQIDFYRDRLQRFDIQMMVKDSSQSFKVYMNKGKLTQIIDNLILNSEYWLKQAASRNEVQQPIITVTFRNPYVTIEDNGIGIDPSIELSLFQPFVTTKPKNEGRGLGLFIISELLDSSGGSISLRPERNEFGRRYIFQIDLTGVINGN